MIIGSALGKLVGGKRKPTVLQTLINDPEAFKLEAYFEGEEIHICIKKKENKKEETES